MTTAKPIFAAFDKGQIPTIACFNNAKTPLGVDLDALITAMHAYINVNGIAMSVFVYPSYSEVFRKPGSSQFAHMNKVKKPFQILSGGYQILFKNGKWTQVTGSAVKKKQFAKEDRRGHRSESRGHKL